MPAGSAFCAQCGYGFGPKRTSFWWGAVVGLMVVGGVVGLLFATGNLQLRGGNNAPAITQQGEAPAPVVQKGPKQMPDDVRAWLEHLERIEKKRVALAQKQLAGATSVLRGLVESARSSADEGSGTESLERPSIRSSVDNVRAPWTALADEFTSMRPPPGCSEIAGNYEQTLREVSAHVVEIIELSESATTNPNAIESLLSLLDSNDKVIDTPAGKADEGVQKICDAYDTRKWFSIQRDIGTGGPTLTMPNIGGLTP